MTTDERVAAALKRLAESLNRSVAQHLRYMRARK